MAFQFKKFNPFEMDIEQKAVHSQSGRATSMTTMIPDTCKLTQDPIALMNYNRGYVYAANTKVAEAVGSLPFRLYAYVPEKQSRTMLTAKKSIKGLKFKALAKQLDLQTENNHELLEIFKHPFLDLIDNPYAGWTRTEFFKVVSSYLGLIGNAYIEVFKNNSGEVTGLKPLQSEYMQIKYDEDGEIITYIYQPTNCQKRTEYEPEGILHIRNRTAGSVIAGMGNLEAALASVNLTTSTQAYLSALLENKAIPGGVFIVKDFKGDEAKATSFRNKLLERFGKRSRGNPMITFGDVEYKDISATMADTRTDFFTAQAKQEIAACFSVPLTLLDESNSNRATALTAQKSMQQYAVYPRVTMILDQINTEIVKKHYDERLMYSYEPSEALDVDPDEQSKVLKVYLDCGMYTINEARAVLGMPNLDNPLYDIPNINKNKTTENPVDGDKEL